MAVPGLPAGVRGEAGRHCRSTEWCGRDGDQGPEGPRRRGGRTNWPTRRPPRRWSGPRARSATSWIVASNMQDAVLIDLAVKAKPDVDVLFLETGYHFAETIGTRDAVATVYPEVRIVNAAGRAVASPTRRRSSGCCTDRAGPLLPPAQGGAAAADAGGLRRVGHRRAPGGRADQGEHADRRLGRAQRPGEGQPDRGVDATRSSTATSPSTASCENPLVADGYLSIGCAPCTAKPLPGAGPAQRPVGRAGQDRVRSAWLRR